MSLYIEVQYRGDWWGEDPLHETDYETPGDLFRALSGRDKSRPWVEPLGRCTGKVYVDVPGSACTLCGKPRADHAGYAVDMATFPDGREYPHHYQAESRQVGWVFVARNPEPVNRGDEQPTGLREAWVTVHERPPSVTRTVHYADFA